MHRGHITTMSNVKSQLRERLIQRADFVSQTRQFFAQRGVIEVETGLLQAHTVSDPYMSAFRVIDPLAKEVGFLQTSPEYAMKKLLCEGAGDIFQLSKMFRANENSPIHSAEFTMLEWYRLGYDHHQLAEEVCQLMVELLGVKPVNKLTYQQAFIEALQVDPFELTYQQLHRLCVAQLGDIPADLLFDNLLTLLFAERVETQFDPEKITVIHAFPESQASLAKTQKLNGISVAQRFEVYFAGVELANGFNELTDASVQLARFEQDNKIREQLGSPKIAIDMELIAALKQGLPDCAGVALGLDRLFMIAIGQQNIQPAMPATLMAH